jgi:hypothetical protein
MLGSETARRIFHMEWLIHDPNVQDLIREWEGKGRAEGHAKGRAEGHAKGRAEGQAKGRAEEARRLLRKVLAARGFTVTAAVRARIDGESDVTRLEAWHEAAVTVAAIGDVFQADRAHRRGSSRTTERAERAPRRPRTARARRRGH